MDRHSLSAEPRFAALRLAMAAALAWAMAPPGSWSAEPTPDDPVTVRSPDDQIRVEFRLEETDGKRGVPTFRVAYREELLLDHSRLGLEFAEGGPLGELRRTGVARADNDETYRLVVGKSSQARDRYREAVVSLEERAPPRRRIDVALRAYDEGVALRYLFPKQPAFNQFVLADESTRFSLVGDPHAWYLPLKNFTTSQEGFYRSSPLSEIPAGTLIAVPLLLKFTKSWVAITEAELTDYAGMYLSPAVPGHAGRPRDSRRQDHGPGRPRADTPGTLVSKLSPWPDQPKVKVKAATPHRSPWRVLMIGDAPGKLIESNLIVHLNPPCAIADASWIRGGKTTFPWWNDYVIPDADFKPGLNTVTMKYYIDFCADHGIEYHSLDGFQDRAWYGGPIAPRGETDVTRAVPEIDLPEVLRYAKQKGVRLRLWMHWLALRPQLDEAFAQYERWGIEGVMIDFMDRDDQEMVRFYHEVARKAAEHRLTVNFHGAYKPTGVRRTWPNLLTREGVLNLEYNKFDAGPCTPEHNLTVPFTRMLAGPLDYHEGAFRTVTRREFQKRWTGPVCIGTRCHYLAMYVVYENPLPMVADYPAAYRDQPEFELVARMPTSWDETRVLNAAVGEAVTIARRRGDVWYVGSMAAGRPRELPISLNFLGDGEFAAEVYHDDLEAEAPPTKVLQRSTRVTAADTLTAKLAADGGHVLRIRPAR